MTYVVIGGGISGISAAITLKETVGDSARVVLLEKSTSLGGKFRSIKMAGKVVETGPDSFLTRTTSGLDLVAKLGLADSIVRPTNFSASIYNRGKLYPLPEGILLGVPTDIIPFLRTASVLSIRGRLRAAFDLVLPRTKLGEDATISHLIRSRFGKEVDQLLVDPMVGGINAGSTRDLGLKSVTSQFMTSYQGSNHRSLARSMTSLPRAVEVTQVREIPFASLDDGLDSLIDAAQRYLISIGVEVWTQAEVIEIHQVSNGYQVELSTENSASNRAESLETAAIAIAIPADGAARLIKPLSPLAFEKVSSISYAGVAMTIMRYPKSAFSRPLNGSGVLVPRTLNKLTTAITFASRKWQRLDLYDSEFLRVSTGRFGDDRFTRISDEELASLLALEVSEILKLTSEPVESSTWRWGSALPQYRPYHAQLVAAARQDLSHVKGVMLCGAAFDGVGIPACIDSGAAAARSMLSIDPRGRQ